MDESLSYLLELRLRLRGRPDALAIVDRALAILGRARSAAPDELVALEREVAALATALQGRFGHKVPMRH